MMARGARCALVLGLGLASIERSFATEIAAPATPGAALASPAVAATVVNLGSDLRVNWPQCASFTKERFDPKCLPPAMQEYSVLGGAGVPYIYTSWMFSETCGLEYTYYRMNHLQSRRSVIFKAAESIFVNWGIFAVATLLATVFMNLFFLAPRGRRCCGLFEDPTEDDEPLRGCTYQKCLAPVYYLLFIWAAVLTGGCVYQFILEMLAYHADLSKLGHAGVLVGQQGLEKYSVPESHASCKDAMAMNWPCKSEMLQILVLAVFCTMDMVMLVGWIFSTVVLACFAMVRQWVGCLCCKACCARPDCLCGTAFNCKICVSWCCCHPLAFCVFFLSVVLVLGAYFAAGLFAGVIFYGILLGLFGAALLVLEFLARQVVVMLSCSRCQTLTIPITRYAMALFPLPQHTLVAPRFKRESLGKRIGKAMEDELSRLGHPLEAPEAGEDGWEREIMGVPHHPLTWSFPVVAAIILMPIIALFIVASIAFPWSDHIIETLSWAEADMNWYVNLMQDGTKAWTWYWEAFCCLLEGLTDSFKELFVTIPHNLRVQPIQTLSDVLAGAKRGLPQWNVFDRGDFAAFKCSVLMGRFGLAFIFACCRITALINSDLSEGDSSDERWGRERTEDDEDQFSDEEDAHEMTGVEAYDQFERSGGFEE